MLEKGNIIEQALITVGNITDYNDNRSNTYTVASKLLENLVDTICKNNDFDFPSTTVRLTTSKTNTFTGEHQYNIPIDFLGVKKQPIVNHRVSQYVESATTLTRVSRGLRYRLEGEYIYSYENPLVLNYVRRLPLSEFPEYIKDYLIVTLAIKLAQTFPMYADKLQYLEMKAREEKNNVLLAETAGIPLNLRGDYNG